MVRGLNGACIVVCLALLAGCSSGTNVGEKDAAVSGSPAGSSALTAGSGGTTLPFDAGVGTSGAAGSSLSVGVAGQIGGQVGAAGAAGRAGSGGQAGRSAADGGGGAPAVAGGGGTAAAAGGGGASAADGGSPVDPSGCGTPSVLVGWATEAGGTTGGEGGETVSVNDLATLMAAVKGTDKKIIQLHGSISGSITIGSNKTLIGCGGAQFKGYISMNKSANVIVRNLKVVGNNCTDNTSDCSAGDDAITVQGGANHLWFDHDDVSDGSDGNLDLTHAVDYVTISWTKFHYSGRRTDPAGANGGHQFSNLVGHSDDNASEDTGHLRITFHHDWWADNVVERMPRVRFGQVHLFDNLYTSTGNDYCIGVGVGANILAENNVFVGVKTPIDGKSFSDAASVIHATGNAYMNTSGVAPADLNPSQVFKPPYTYQLDDTSKLMASIVSGAGPQ